MKTQFVPHRALPTGSIFRIIGLAFFASFFGGCISHGVKFEDAHYDVPKSNVTQSGDTALAVVIDGKTLEQQYTIHSWMTGIGNNWNAEPGKMLRDVVAIEFPQAFGTTKILQAYQEPSDPAQKLTIELTIPHYVFTEFHASVDVRAVAYHPGHRLAFDKTYHAEGFKQGTKMLFAGAFGMKSAIRQSSLDAYKKIFAQLRQDVSTALTSVK